MSEYEGFRHLPIEFFDTDGGRYVFDAHHVCFFEVGDVCRDVLGLLRQRPLSDREICDLLPQRRREDVLRACQELRELQSRGQFQPAPFERAPRQTGVDIESLLSEHLAGLTFFVTTRCNLACSYCIYGGSYQQHGKLDNETMRWPVVRAAMEFLERHSRQSEEVRVDFFGGEPLLAFPLIERGVRYLESLVSSTGPRVQLAVTSNGTILNDRILDFLVKRKAHLQFSLDGGPQTHDRHRPYKISGRGSYQTVMQNLERIHRRSPRFFQDHVCIKGVVTPDRISEDEEFADHPLVRLLADQGHVNLLRVEPLYDPARDQSFFALLDNLEETLLALRELTTIDEIPAALTPKEQAVYFTSFVRFFDVQATNQVHFSGRKRVPFTKGCVTGYQQGAVRANGDIYICLKAAKGEDFVIGNVYHGWDFAHIRELSNRLLKRWPSCKSCFLRRACDLCFEKLDGNPGCWSSSRRSYCAFNRRLHRQVFTTMLRVCENNPPLWYDLEQIVMRELQETGSGPADRTGGIINQPHPSTRDNARSQPWPHDEKGPPKEQHLANPS